MTCSWGELGRAVAAKLTPMGAEVQADDVIAAAPKSWQNALAFHRCQ